VRQKDVRLAFAFEVHQVAALVVVGCVDFRLGPIARLSQSVAIVVNALAEPIDADNAGPAVALDVHRRVHEVVEIALALLVHVSPDRADLERFELGGQVEEIAGDDVELPVAVEVGHTEGLTAERADPVFDEPDSTGGARPGRSIGLGKNQRWEEDEGQKETNCGSRHGGAPKCGW